MEPNDLENIIDDDEVVQQCFQWLVAEMSNGRTVEELTAEMLASDWSQDDADELVEAARKKTLPLRGGITRNEVERESRMRYRKAMSRVWLIPVLGIAGVALANVISAVRHLIKDRSKQNPRD